MRIVEDKVWTWFLPDNKRAVDQERWLHHGGKWIVFARKEKVMELAYKLESFINSGSIESAKCWNGDPSAINVYSLDKDREKIKEILEELGAARHKVWEYDYEWGKNVTRPIDFLYSWSSKLMTIFKSYGVGGTARLFKDMMSSD